MEEDKDNTNKLFEFLTVYGWAILVVIAAIAALAYFGVLGPNKEECLGMTKGERDMLVQIHCLDGTILNKATCNEATRTWWFEFVPNQPQEGCSPACVINVDNRTAEINWRCTGLILE